jgi:hypothetical protein
MEICAFVGVLILASPFILGYEFWKRINTKPEPVKGPTDEHHHDLRTCCNDYCGKDLEN